MTRLSGVAALILSASLALTACGGDDKDDKPTDPKVDKATTALGLALQKDSQIDEQFEVFSTDEGKCIAGGIVDELGVDQLVELKVVADDLGSAAIPDVVPEPMRKPQVDAMSECVGVIEYVVRNTRALFRSSGVSNPEAQLRADDDEFWASTTKCLKGEISEDAMKQILLDSVAKPKAGQKKLSQALQKCMA